MDRRSTDARSSIRLPGNVAIGLVGAVIGGFLFSALGYHGPAGFLTSLVVAVIGAALLLLIGNVIAN